MGFAITPFMKQAFVVAGAAINRSQFGMVMGFTAILLPQLRSPTSVVPIDDSSGSWIAAIPGFSLMIGNFLIPPIMGKFGRKRAALISIIFIVSGWLLIAVSKNTTSLMAARFLQGISMGMSSSLSPIMVGECTSPKNRGGFVTCISVATTISTLIVHTLGSYLSWQRTALICVFISLSSLIIVSFSPESPSWLANQGKYEECSNVFHWLRGDDEQDELERLIETSKLSKEFKSAAPKSILKRISSNVIYFKETMKKKEFYKPIIVMMHVFSFYQWGGINLLAAYTVDMILNVVGDISNVPVLIISIDIFRLCCGFLAIYLIKSFKRRTVLTLTVGLNAVMLYVIAGYTYLKVHNMLPFDHPSIGVALIFIHTFSIGTGSVPFPMVLSGEVFPLAYRSFSGGISSLFCSISLFIMVKSARYLFNAIGIYGAYCLYGLLVTYCLIMTLSFLPETKDRMLQDIEDEFRGEKKHEELVHLKALNNEKQANICDSESDGFKKI